jgi:hypothetical protein
MSGHLKDNDCRIVSYTMTAISCYGLDAINACHADTLQMRVSYLTAINYTELRFLINTINATSTPRIEFMSVLASFPRLIKYNISHNCAQCSVIISTPMASDSVSLENHLFAYLKYKL